MSCIDFEVSHGELGLTLELNCSASVWKQVPTIEYEEDHAITGAPGVILRNGSLHIWTRITIRTCSIL